MIPRNSFTSPAVVSEFIPPGDDEYTALVERQRGGLAISDGSHGRDTQTWSARYEDGDINLYAEGEDTPAYTLTVAGVTALSLAFDNNMRPVFVYQTVAGSTIYYYDTVSESYQTITLADVTSSRVCVDDVRDIYNESSDVIWAYVRDSQLYWRQQRDRYGIERLVGPAYGLVLTRVGQSHGRRLTFKLQFVDPES